MPGFDAPNWGGMLAPDLSLAESFLRGTLVYFGILVIFRLVLKRQAGGVGLPDIMLVVLVSECVSSSINAEAKSVANGLVAVAAMMFWSFAIDWASFHWPWLRRQLEPKPLELVRDGKKIEQNMRAEQVTDEELVEQLRLNGVEDVSRVKVAYIESCGGVSVIPKEEPQPPEQPNAAQETSPTGPPTASDGVPDFERTMKHFLSAAAELRAAVEWHDARAAEHRRAAKEMRDTLAHHGLRGRKWLEHDDHPADEPGGQTVGRNGVHPADQ
jgi:uncharacterized membrane protein YcaP (DUF421 family)